MTIISSRPRKRPFDWDASLELWENDTIAVVPRNTAALPQLSHIPMKQTSPKGSGRSSAQASVLVHLAEVDQSPQLQVRITNTPETCCYRCRHRGGRAAYKCLYDEPHSCRLCLRENNGKCRMPTEEEAVDLANRCPHCVRRGFKNCIGRPCNPCINEGKANTCGDPAPPRKRARREHTPAISKRSVSTGRESNLPLRRSMRVNEPSGDKDLDYSHTEHDGSESQGDIAAAINVPSLASLFRSTEHDSQESKMDPNSLSGAHDFSENDSGHSTNALGAEASSPLFLTEDWTANTADMGNDSSVHLHMQQQEHPTTSTSARPQRQCKTVSYVNLVSDDEMTDGEDDKGIDAHYSPSSTSFVEDTYSTSESISFEAAASDTDESIEDVDTILEHKSKPKYKIKDGKGLNLNLPPLDNIQDIFEDMVGNAIDVGLFNAVKKIKRPLNVATMCSGTESPLLALDLISQSLIKAGLCPLAYTHAFSAEIDVVKQAFIERNFQPPIIFRDVRDFLSENAKTAITAYGAEALIPFDVDILVAGFVCKDLSNLNSKQKALSDDGESGDTWRAIYQYSEIHRPKVVLLENVKNKKALWDTLVDLWDEIGYEATWVYCDTKSYYLPQTRERMYMIAVERNSFGRHAENAVTQWKSIMCKLRRQCSSPYEAFLKHRPVDSIEYTRITSEPDWALCKLRMDSIRSEERLGISRPITRWSENGTIKPLDYAHRQFLNSQSARVFDAIEVAHLQAAKNCNDSLYKMLVWDVSQNVDRFKATPGILSCITPGGCNFASNQQRALDGSELLLLQGMPLSKLHFARETQKERQDLAGNAMSTTVIGASLISTIISAAEILAKTIIPKKSASSQSSSSVRIPKSHAMKVVPSTDININTKNVAGSRLEQLKHDALLSSRLCACEKGISVSNASIHVCASCDHKACGKCAGNPRHKFREIISARQRALGPDNFLIQWKPHLPMRLKVKSFMELQRIMHGTNDVTEEARMFTRTLKKVPRGPLHFTFKELKREYHVWKVVYVSSHAHLELQISQKVTWLLYMNCPRELPGNSQFRALFERPLAKAVAERSLLDLDWQVCLPSVKVGQIEIRSSSDRTASWRNRLGLVDFKTETVPTTLVIRGKGEIFACLNGQYELQSDCGTACNSLYKQTGADSYLFLDPNPIGDPDNDCFVFSHDCSRKIYGEARMISTRLDSSWRPWTATKTMTSVVDATRSGRWVPFGFDLQVADLELSAQVLNPVDLLLGHDQDCLQSIAILEVDLGEKIHTKDYTWALEAVKQVPSLTQWRSLGQVNGRCSCCAPDHPQILWHVDDNNVAIPHEDRKAASAFERNIKTRPPIIEAHDVPNTINSRTVIGVNVQSLAHRAIGRLNTAVSALVAWRLLTDHIDLPIKRFPLFRLSSNAADIAPAIIPDVISYLSNAQWRSVFWMRNQELGKSITLTEVEEEIHSSLGWRAEARAETTITVKGGVLADLPSFGKTVTTIALIQSEFDEHEPNDLIDQNQSKAANTPKLIDSAATLIVCPPHLALQWGSELRKFLGDRQFDSFNVIVIQDIQQLSKLTISDILNSRVIIVSWNLFGQGDYVTHIAQFTAMPEPIMKGRRSFQAWLSRALEECPGQIGEMQNHDFQDFQDATNQLLEKRMTNQEFQDVLPLRIQHGSAYQSFNAMQAAASKSRGKAKAQSSTKVFRSHTGKKNEQLPLLHLFRFNRVVIDEYHYLSDKSNAISSVCIKNISAHKRWVLSGTPALNRFTDVDQLASFLGFKLGRHHPGDGDKAHREELTTTESFLAQTETMSNQWHEDRHFRAQKFLDTFVRQNLASLGHIACEEMLASVSLSKGHRAVYLEHSQHLSAQRMQFKKLNSKMKSDKFERLSASLKESATGEEALLKCALLFDTNFETLVAKRSDQCREIKAKLLKELSKFECLHKSNDIYDLWSHFVNDIKHLNWLGDEEASQCVRDLLADAGKGHKISAQSRPNDHRSSTKMEKQPIKHDVATVRELSRELVFMIRTERFLNTIKQFQQPARSISKQKFSCSALTCEGLALLPQLHIAINCGHTFCDDCARQSPDQDTCIHPLCTLPVHDLKSVNAKSLAPSSSEAQNSSHSFGKKLDAITDIISNFSQDDQGLVFAPNDEIIASLEEVFDYYDISYHSIRQERKAQVANILKDFQSDKNPISMKKVLLLNLGSETAAGVNLVNANHVIFAAPLLAKTQYEYESAMAQAIARSRRYGQRKKVYIYHVVALHTIDVDIIEQRHKCTDAIYTSGTSMKFPQALEKKEASRLVKFKKGGMALIPKSWLQDEATRTMLSVDESIESFTSLIPFSESFQQDEED